MYRIQVSSIFTREYRYRVHVCDTCTRYRYARVNIVLQYAGVIEAYWSRHMGKCSRVCCPAALAERRNVRHWSAACWTSTHTVDAVSSPLDPRNSTNTASTSISSYKLLLSTRGPVFLLNIVFFQLYSNACSSISISYAL